MIETLRIEGIAVVDEAELEFGPGLNVLTGETGAGKSIVLGALSLLSGGKASSDSLREGVAQGRVEAVFSTRGLPEVEAELLRRELRGEAEEDDHELVVSRTLVRNGRSRARLMGQLVPVSMLSDLFDGLIEISSQHSSQSLLRPETQGLFLDLAGGLLPQREKVMEGYAALRAVESDLHALRSRAEERARRRDFLAFQLAELEDVGLEPGELDALSAEHSRLAHADRLRAEGGAAVAAVTGDAMESGSGGRGAVDGVASARRLLEGLEEADPGLAPLAERLRVLEAELADAAADLERYLDNIEGDPGRLTQLDERLAQVEQLRRKYGRGEEEIFAFRDEVARELSTLDGDDERGGSLEAEAAKLRKRLAKDARQLTKGREKAAVKLAAGLEKELVQLAMPKARFEVHLRPVVEIGLEHEEGGKELPCGPTGAEATEFQFSANPGESPRPLRKVASGGELSRLFLALKNSLRGATAGMVLVFDEVDAGVGGGVAERIGRVLAQLAEDHQVLCITHLPQIAVFADTHFRVEKTESKGRTRATIERIEGDARVDEIARMAAGESVTEVTRAHARDLLRAKSPS